MTKIHVKQVRSKITQPQDQVLTLRGLGLKRRGQEVVLRDTPAIRGMIRKVQHLVEVRVVEGEAELFGIRHRANQPRRSRQRQSE
jgi:large subunit ribosomal protein L30